MKQLLSILYILFLVGLYSACSNKDNDVDPESGFTKIYDVDSIETNHFAVDIKQMDDLGYLFLGYNLQGRASSLVVRIDKVGKLIWSQTFPQYLSPVSELMKIGGSYYFVCAKVETFEIVLLKVIDTKGNVEEIAKFDEGTRPLAACALPDGGILIQTYDFPNAQTILMKLNSSFSLDNNFSTDGKHEYEIDEADLMDERITNHLNFRGDRLPFLVSYVGDNLPTKYVFNGVRDLDISLIFVNTSSGVEEEAVDGRRYNKCISSFVNLGSGKAALSKFEEVDNSFIPQFNLNVLQNEIVNVSDLIGINKPEIVQNSDIKSKVVMLKGRKLIIYTTSIKNNSVGLFAYDAGDGKFVGARYFGNTYPYMVGNFTTTSDGGLAVLCQTYVAGRFPRLCLFKLSKGQSEDFIK